MNGKPNAKGGKPQAQVKQQPSTPSTSIQPKPIPISKQPPQNKQNGKLQPQQQPPQPQVKSQPHIKPLQPPTQHYSPVPQHREVISVLNKSEHNSSDSSNDSDSESSENEAVTKFNNLKLRRTDSISKYKAKQLLKLQQQQQEKLNTPEDEIEDEDETLEDSDQEEEDDEQPILDINKISVVTTPPPSSTTPIINTNNSNSNEVSPQEKRGTVPNIIIPPSTIQEEVKKKRQSLDSDDEDFGYDDNLQFTVVQKKQSPRSENLKPINNPIPKRPILQVDPSKEYINVSMIALRTTIRIGTDKIDQLTQNDFIHFKKYRISIAEKRTLIKDFSPNVFHNLRNRLNIDPTEFLKSWSSFINLSEIEKKTKTPDFAICSSDKKYIMKILSKSDSVRLRTLLPHYYNYIIYNPNSLLEKYLGLYRIGPKSTNVYVVLLHNIYETSIHLNETFTTTGLTTSSSSLKKLKTPTKKLNLDKFTKQTLYQQLEKDSNFLSSQDLVDYSLKVGVLNNKNKIKEDLIVNKIEIDKEDSNKSTLPNISTDLNNSSNGNNNLTTPPPSSSTPQILVNEDINILTMSNNTNGNSTPDATINSTPPSSPNSNIGSPRISAEMDPIKSVPRLLYFIEGIETVVKSNNVKISKSLKKSFAALPRSWSLEDFTTEPGTTSSGSNSTTNNSGSNNSSATSSPNNSVKSSSYLSPLNNNSKHNGLLLSTSTPTTSILTHSLGNLPTLPTIVNNIGGTTTLSSSANGTSVILQQHQNPLINSPSKYPFKILAYNSMTNSPTDESEETYYFGITDFLSKQKKIAAITKQSISPNANQYLKKFLSNVKDNFFS